MHYSPAGWGSRIDLVRLRARLDARCSQTKRQPAACGLRGCLAGSRRLAASLDSATGLNRATHLGALAVDLADGAAPAEVCQGRHVEVERLLLALRVADTREVAVDVEKVVSVGLALQVCGCVSRKRGHALRLAGYTVLAQFGDAAPPRTLLCSPLTRLVFQPYHLLIVLTRLVPLDVHDHRLRGEWLP